MNSSRNVCPSCHTASLSVLQVEFAYLRRFIRCEHCGVRLRAVVPFQWKLVGRIGGPLMLWIVIVLGLKLGLGVSLSVASGAVCFALIEHWAERRATLTVF